MMFKKAIIVAIFFFSMMAVNAFYEIKENCPNGICVANQPIEWNVTIHNKGRNDLRYTVIELLDARDDSIIAILDVEYRPLNSDQGPLIEILPTRQVTVNISGAFPGPDNKSEIVYYPCFSIAAPGNDWIRRSEEVYELRHCYANETTTVYECVKDGHCSSDSFCHYNKCLPLQCGACQYVKKNMCHDYECCESNACEDDEVCSNNECTPVLCRENEAPFNHSCVPLECAEEEAIVNHRCGALQCDEGEFASNHTCTKLLCDEDEYVDGNECKELLCASYEGIMNHTCVALQCAYNEKIIDHQCVALSCRFFQRIENRECVSDAYRMQIFLAEIVALAVIVFFAVLDIRKYEMIHKKPSTPSKKSFSSG